MNPYPCFCLMTKKLCYECGTNRNCAKKFEAAAEVALVYHTTPQEKKDAAVYNWILTARLGWFSSRVPLYGFTGHKKAIEQAYDERDEEMSHDVDPGEAVTLSGADFALMKDELEQAKREARVCRDIHKALGVEWGHDVHAKIIQLKAAKQGILAAMNAIAMEERKTCETLCRIAGNLAWERANNVLGTDHYRSHQEAVAKAHTEDAAAIAAILPRVANLPTEWVEVDKEWPPQDEVVLLALHLWGDRSKPRFYATGSRDPFGRWSSVIEGKEFDELHHPSHWMRIKEPQ